MWSPLWLLLDSTVAHVVALLASFATPPPTLVYGSQLEELDATPLGVRLLLLPPPLLALQPPVLEIYVYAPPPLDVGKLRVVASFLPSQLLS